jgi:hypothetical protein
MVLHDLPVASLERPAGVLAGAQSTLEPFGHGDGWLRLGPVRGSCDACTVVGPSDLVDVCLHSSALSSGGRMLRVQILRERVGLHGPAAFLVRAEEYAIRDIHLDQMAEPVWDARLVLVPHTDGVVMVEVSCW